MSLRDQFLPASIRAMIQDGLLERAFQDALAPTLLYPLAGELFPIQGQQGSTITQTRNGLLTPSTTPLGAADPAGQKWSIEQWSVTLNDYGESIDTDKLAGETAIDREFIQDTMAIAQNAGASLNQLARDKLYAAYSSGRTHVTAATGPLTTITVEDATGFDTVLVNGVPTPVSASNPLSISVEESGTPQTVGVEGVAGNVLTLDTSVTVIVGDRVIADNSPYTVYAGTGNTVTYDLTAGDVVTLADFRAAVVRLRRQHVPPIAGGKYVAHVNSVTENQLFDDNEFQNVLNTNITSPEFRDLAIGEAAGIIFVRNEEAPTFAAADFQVDGHRPIVLGGRALMNAPWQAYETGLAVGNTQGARIEFIDVGIGLPVAWIVNPPTDVMQRFITSAWGWIGDFGVPSDSLTGDPSLFKRAVVIEHSDS